MASHPGMEWECPRSRSPSRSPRPTVTERQKQGERTYVLDTSVLLCDPKAIFRFAEHSVVLPVIVITELEAKRNDPEIGYFARQALRNLDELRVAARAPRLPDRRRRRGGIAARRAEPLEHVGAAVRAAAGRQRLPHPRGRAQPRQRRPRRHRRLEGPAAARQGRVHRPRRRGVPGRAGRRLRLDRAWPRSTSRASRWPSCTTTRQLDLARRAGPAGQHRPGHPLGPRLGPRPGRRPRASCRLVRGDRDVFGLHGRSAEQRLAIDLLLDPEIGIVSLGGRAGTGKSALALCAGLEAVLEKQQHRKIMVFRPLYAVGGQELGYLPGDTGREDEPLGPGGLRHPRRPGLARTCSTRSSSAACSRCCRSPTSAVARCTTRS